MSKHSPVALAVVLTSAICAAQQPAAGAKKDVGIADRHETFGAVLMPPALPSGSTAAYGFIGAQEIGGGYRQGTSGIELEVRGRFNYLLLAFGVDVAAKYLVLARGRMEIAPALALGVGYDTGSHYFDPRNFQGLTLRIEPGVIGAYRIHDTLRGFALLQVPIDLGVAPAGGYRVMPLVGGGVEFYLGDELSVMGQAAMGPDVMREPNGFAAWRIGYSVKLGVGYRIF